MWQSNNDILSTNHMKSACNFQLPWHKRWHFLAWCLLTTKFNHPQKFVPIHIHTCIHVYTHTYMYGYKFPRVIKFCGFHGHQPNCENNPSEIFARLSPRKNMRHRWAGQAQECQLSFVTFVRHYSAYLSGT